MIVYVNGDSHSAGAEIANPHCFAQDDPLYWALGRQPHPDNLKLSYGCLIANELGAILTCDAESAASNDRIMRTTWPRIESVQGGFVQEKPDLVIIGWSTWEREEWLHNNIHYQVTASGTDTVPRELQQRYREWVVDQTHVTRERKLLGWHDQIWRLHQALENKNIPHIFFNTYSDFANIRSRQITTDTTKVVPNEHDWGLNYVGPYDSNLTYYNWCIQKGFKTVNGNSYHFGADAHQAWAEFLMQYYVQILLTKKS